MAHADDELREKGQAQRERMAARGRAQSRAASEIGPPPITAKQRAAGTRLRKKCANDLELFNSAVFPYSTGLKPFGPVQKQSIQHDQQAIRFGSRVCKAEPRAYGKTTRTGNAALWAICYGYRRMIPVFCANQDKSKSLMDRWQTEIMTNEKLLWMFPELIWPLRALERRSQRCAGQTYKGIPTSTSWTSDRIVFPTIEGVIGSGSVLLALPLVSCRGVIHASDSGEVLRPDLIVFDDVATDEQSANPATVAKLEDLIDHTAMMLGGHHQTMSAIMNCTVREVDDLSERYLKKPGWNRVRFKMLEKPATNESEFWLGRYADILTSYDPDNPTDQRRAQLEALALYKAEREYADDGAVVTWEHAYAWNDPDPIEISAIQHAYNLRIANESVFNCECQNTPSRHKASGVDMLTAPEIRAKVAKPTVGATTLVSFVDMSQEVLYYDVFAFDKDTSGFQLTVAGTWPRQTKSEFNHRLPPLPLSKVFPGLSVEAQITKGLDTLLHGDGGDWPGLMSMEWDIHGTPCGISKCGVDANGEHRDLIVNLLTRSNHRANLIPTFGIGIPAKNKPMAAWQNYRKQRSYDNWLWLKGNRGEIPGLQFDTNSWKSRVHKALSAPAGTLGATYLNPDAFDRVMVSNHLTAEYPQLVTSGTNVVSEWSLLPARDNHRLDTFTGCMLMSSVCGIGRERPTRKAARSRRRVSYG